MTIARLIAGRGTEVWSCRSDDSFVDAVAMLATRRIGALPVFDAEGRIAGIFSERDVLYCLHSRGDEALGLMTRRRFRHLPVESDEGVIGFVSIGDLVKYRIDRIEAEAEAMRSYIQTA